MRILVALTPERSFFYYLAPLAWALRSAGHDVRVASAGRLAPAITAAGLTAVPVGRDRDAWRVVQDDPVKLSAMRADVAPPYDVFADPDRASWDYLRSGMAAAVRGWHRLSNFPLIADLVEYAREWKPDLVLWEPLCYAGPIAAQACGAVHGRLLWGIDVFGAVREAYLRRMAEQPEPEQNDPLAEWFAGYGRRYGFTPAPEMATGQFTVDQLPPSLRLDSKLETLLMQYVPYGGAAVIPAWLDRPAGRPRVGLTLGTTATEQFNGYNVPVADLIEQLSTLDIELVATIADSQRHRLRTVPDNVRVVSYVPWHALVPTCAAIIHHAGAATLATTARHPVPQLALHHHFDQPFLGRRLAEHGAGLEIAATKATGDNVRDAVHRLLTEPSFARRARALADEIRGLPSPTELVPRIEAFVDRRRP
jgi:glycosyltransferase (activator-dependent family)